MSIIDEALRRVQDSTGKAFATPPPAAPPQAPVARPQQPPQESRAPEPPPLVHSWQPSTPAAPTAGPQNGPLFAVVGAVLLLTVVLVIGGAFWIGRALNSNGRGVQVSIAAPNAPAEQPAPAEPEPKPAKSVRPRPAPKASGNQSTSLILSGIVEGLGEPYAVINGLIVAAGERVSNATLERIENGSVLLRRDDGREITLSVPR